MKKLSWLIVSLTFILSSITLTADDRNKTKNLSLMQPLTFSEWEKQRKNYLGNILVADMWATWCTSCLERFPKMVELDKKYKDKPVKFISLNLDSRDDKLSIQFAEKFLKKMNADFEHYFMDENLMQAFEYLNLIGIPVVIIYDETGKERYRLTGDNPNNQFTDQDIEKSIKVLIGNE